MTKVCATTYYVVFFRIKFDLLNYLNYTGQCQNMVCLQNIQFEWDFIVYTFCRWSVKFERQFQLDRKKIDSIWQKEYVNEMKSPEEMESVDQAKIQPKIQANHVDAIFV